MSVIAALTAQNTREVRAVSRGGAGDGGRRRSDAVLEDIVPRRRQDRHVGERPR